MVSMGLINLTGHANGPGSGLIKFQSKTRICSVSISRSKPRRVLKLVDPSSRLVFLFKVVELTFRPCA
jgi:hypothetical protein